MTIWKEYPKEKPTDKTKLYVVNDGYAQTIRKWNGERFYGIEDKKFLWKVFKYDNLHAMDWQTRKA